MRVEGREGVGPLPWDEKRKVGAYVWLPVCCSNVLDMTR